MSINAVLIRFGLAYVLLLVGVSVTVALLDAPASSAIGNAALMGAAVWVCLSFAKANNRYFLKEEKTKAVLGMLAIDIVIQALIAAGLIASQGGSVASGAFLFALALASVLHGVMLYFIVSFAGKMFAKQIAKNG